MKAAGTSKHSPVGAPHPSVLVSQEPRAIAGRQPLTRPSAGLGWALQAFLTPLQALPEVSSWQEVPELEMLAGLMGHAVPAGYDLHLWATACNMPAGPPITRTAHEGCLSRKQPLLTCLHDVVCRSPQEAPALTVLPLHPLPVCRTAPASPNARHAVSVTAAFACCHRGGFHQFLTAQ